MMIKILHANTEGATLMLEKILSTLYDVQFEESHTSVAMDTWYRRIYSSLFGHHRSLENSNVNDVCCSKNFSLCD
ncbi:unnamed protein product [Periconia digitata]|uniref:Uncharacterized protein n=1 Tax=Periconia digitata TaxID=1303443 RepID=A0A9W4UR22_9PLEO|nr:unnamed protein product [Periconia digitata]